MKIEQEKLETLRNLMVNLMIDFGPDRHCDGSDAILYAILKFLDYEVPFLDEYVRQVDVDRMIKEYRQKR